MLLYCAGWICHSCKPDQGPYLDHALGWRWWGRQGGVGWRWWAGAAPTAANESQDSIGRPGNRCTMRATRACQICKLQIKLPGSLLGEGREAGSCGARVVSAGSGGAWCARGACAGAQSAAGQHARCGPAAVHDRWRHGAQSSCLGVGSIPGVPAAPPEPPAPPAPPVPGVPAWRGTLSVGCTRQAQAGPARQGDTWRACCPGNSCSTCMHHASAAVTLSDHEGTRCSACQASSPGVPGVPGVP